MNDPRPRAGLVRGLGLWPAIAVNVGNMIGTGVFLKTRVMTCNVGSPLVVLAVWTVAGILSLAGTFCYAEVSAMIPEAGGDYVYLRRAYGRLTAFLFGWMFLFVARSGAQAALAVGFAIFTNVALGGALEGDAIALPGLGLHLPWLAVAALAAIWTVTLINCGPVASGGHWAVVLTAVKALLLLAIAAGAFRFATGHWSHLAMTGAGATCEGVEAGARGGLAGFGAAMLGALWGYDGWNNVAPLAGEIRDPARNLPRSLFGGTLVVGALYLLVNVAYFYVLTPAAVAGVPPTSSVATEVLKTFIGPAAITLVAVALMLSSFGSLHASVLAGARVPYAQAREGLLFRALGVLSPRTHVPVRALLVSSSWASLLALTGSYDFLTDSMIFAGWVFYGLVGASVFVFRRTMPDAIRPYRAFGYPWVPLAFVLVTIALLVNTLATAPKPALFGAASLLTGLPFYFYFTRRGAVTPP